MGKIRLEEVGFEDAMKLGEWNQKEGNGKDVVCEEMIKDELGQSGTRECDRTAGEDYGKMK